MNEYVCVEFCDTDWVRLKAELDSLDVCLMNTPGTFVRHFVDITTVTGKISSEQATVIKLSNTYLAERMRVSYISDELKDRYRRK